MNDTAQDVMARVEALGRISDEPGRLTRTFCSPAMRKANALVGQWMRQAGMEVRQDAIGNLIGHYAAKRPKASPHGDPKTLLLGSHLDTVRNAGKFDGALGVLLALACVEKLHRQNLRLPFAIEVIGFADEEGVRFQSAYLGSRALAGRFDESDLKREDAEGIEMAEALRRFGGHPGRVKGARLEPARILGYVEAHIEQGPVLEQNNLPVAVVSAIAGQTRWRFTFTGRAGHAGTTPMDLRRDALCAAAEFVLAVEGHARKTYGLVATVGQIKAEPGASNVIPGSAALSVDVRHQRDSVREAAGARLRQQARLIAGHRRVKAHSRLIQRTPSVRCCPKLSGLLKRAVRRRLHSVLSLPSGAGHDAAVLATVAPAALLFIRCKNGVSHHPAEAVRIQDVRAALAVLEDFLRLLANQYGRL
jgi:allantoate deiminase